MIDIAILRNDPARVKANCRRRGAVEVDIDALHDLDREYLALVRATEDMRAERNRLSKLCRDHPEARGQVKELKSRLAEQEARMHELKVEVEG